MRYIAVLLPLLVAISGCEKATEPAVATTLGASSSVNVAAAVGAPVSPSPSVIVKDQHGSPMAGIPVTFTVTAGGGTVTGGSVTTGVDGTATVGSWVLGTTVAQNILTASSGTLAAVSFTATATAGPPTAATKAGGDNTGVVGSAVTNPPSVLVKDAYGNPAPGVSVTFTVGIGGGKITDSVRTTGADGRATLGSWTLGTVATTNTVNATAGSLPPLLFVVAAASGPAARIFSIVGNAQTGRVGAVLQQPIAVRVTDAYDNSKAGLNVTFAVTQGGGSIVGPPTSTTTSDGIAFVAGWTMGPSAGVNLLTATLAGVGTVTFSATAVVPDCTDASHTLGTTTAGQLAATDCVRENTIATDYYRMIVSGARSIEVRQTSTEIDSYTVLTDANGFLLAEDDDDNELADTRMHVLLPPATYRIGASSFDGDFGRYNITSAVVNESEEGCQFTFLVVGVTTSQSITNTDCVSASNATLHADLFIIRLHAGALVTLHSSSRALNPALELYNSFGNPIATTYGLSTTTATDAEIRFMSSVDDYYYLVAPTVQGNQTGAYDLSITTSGASANASTTRGNVSTAASAAAVRPHKKHITLPWAAKK